MLKAFLKHLTWVRQNPFVLHLQVILSLVLSITSEKEKKEMRGVPYASVVGSLMYVMVCTRLNIPHAVSVPTRFLSNSGKEYWTVVK